MRRSVQIDTVRRIVTTQMPTRWGVFQVIGFERDTSNGSRSVQTALAIVMGDLHDPTAEAPLLRGIRSA